MTETLADDCETVLRLLADVGNAGLSQDDIETRTQWGLSHVNDTLCSLTLAKKRQVESFKEKGAKGRKITKYRLILRA